MKRIVTVRENGSKRVILDFSDEICITDQAPAKEMSMMSIVKKIQMGNFSGFGSFTFSGDESVPVNVSNYQDVFDYQNRANRAYEQLPTEIRTLMGNDPRNLESVLLDSKNKDVLLKYGLIVDNKTVHSVTQDQLEELRNLNQNLKNFGSNFADSSPPEEDSKGKKKK